MDIVYFSEVYARAYLVLCSPTSWLVHVGIVFGSVGILHIIWMESGSRFKGQITYSVISIIAVATLVKLVLWLILPVPN